MFTQKELESIDPNYFKIIKASCFCVTLQSKNTRHYWHIIHIEYPSFQTCQIYHNHNKFGPYHQHRNSPTLGKAIQEIQSHDYYQINVRDKAKKARHKLSEAGL